MIREKLDKYYPGVSFDPSKLLVIGMQGAIDSTEIYYEANTWNSDDLILAAENNPLVAALKNTGTFIIARDEDDVVIRHGSDFDLTSTENYTPSRSEWYQDVENDNSIDFIQRLSVTAHTKAWKSSFSDIKGTFQFPSVEMTGPDHSIIMEVLKPLGILVAWEGTKQGTGDTVSAPESMIDNSSTNSSHFQPSRESNPYYTMLPCVPGYSRVYVYVNTNNRNNHPGSTGVVGYMKGNPKYDYSIVAQTDYSKPWTNIQGSPTPAKFKMRYVVDRFLSPVIDADPFYANGTKSCIFKGATYTAAQLLDMCRTRSEIKPHVPVQSYIKLLGSPSERMSIRSKYTENVIEGFQHYVLNDMRYVWSLTKDWYRTYYTTGFGIYKPRAAAKQEATLKTWEDAEWEYLTLFGLSPNSFDDWGYMSLSENDRYRRLRNKACKTNNLHELPVDANKSMTWQELDTLERSLRPRKVYAKATIGFAENMEYDLSKYAKDVTYVLTSGTQWSRTEGGNVTQVDTTNPNDRGQISQDLWYNNVSGDKTTLNQQMLYTADELQARDEVKDLTTPLYADIAVPTGTSRGPQVGYGDWIYHGTDGEFVGLSDEQLYRIHLTNCLTGNDMIHKTVRLIEDFSVEKL